MFRQVLESIVTRAPGGMAAIVMGMDGIAIDHFAAPGSGVDPEAVGAGFSVAVREVKSATSLIDAGAAQGLSVQTERYTTVFELLTDDYFVALTVGPGSPVGKARYLLRVHRDELAAALS